MRKAILILLALPLLVQARKFYDDDPIWKEPELTPVSEAGERKRADMYDYFLYTFGSPQEKHKDVPSGRIPARAVNTLGEPYDSQWFTNRIGRRAMSMEELRRGPGDDRPPSSEGKWTIVSAKTEGVTPGFMIQDSTGQRYLLKFDPMSNPEMASAADVLGTRFFHALGYWTPENYLVRFRPERLEIGQGTTVTDPAGKERRMEDRDIQPILRRVPKRPDGSIRALASRFLKGRPMGGFRYHGTRSDDPNDITPHEHRRDLRGLFVFTSWLGHDDSRGINTLDMLVEEGGKKFFRHHLIDFGSILGSASGEANSPRGGNQYLYDPGVMLKQIFTLGLAVPRWYRWRYKKYPAIGRFEHEIYRPDEWVPEYRNPAFSNRLPDDTFWGAKKVMAFSDEAIAEIVKLAEYSDPEAEAWMVECLIKRRDKVGREYFPRVLPLDNFTVRDGRLTFEHLGERYGFFDAPKIRISWSRFDNEAETHAPIKGVGAELPAAVRLGGSGEYFAAKLVGDEAAKTVTVYLRTGGAPRVVGIDRDW